MTTFRKMNGTHILIGEQLRNDLLKDQGIFKKCVNIGCGHDYIKNWVNIDIDASLNPDIICNLDSEFVRIPLSNDSQDLVWAMHILEHIHYLPQLKDEFCRILKPGGSIGIVVPDYTSPDAWGDDTHCRAFSIQSFLGMYWPGFENGCHVGNLTATGDVGEMKWIYAFRQKKGSIVQPVSSVGSVVNSKS